MPKSSWTETSPVNLLVNPCFQADGTYATGWSIEDATIAITSGACVVTATADGGRIYQTISGLRPSAEYYVGVSIDGGATALAGRIYTTGGAQNFDQTFTTTDSAVVGGIVRTDATGTAIVLSLSVVTSGNVVTYDDAFFFTGNVRFWATHNALDMWRHHTDPTKMDGGDLHAASVANAAFTSLDTDTYNDSTAKVLGTDADGGFRADHAEFGNVTGATEGVVKTAVAVLTEGYVAAAPSSNAGHRITPSSNAASRNWGLVSDVTVYGDCHLMTETTKNGGLDLKRISIDASGNFWVPADCSALTFTDRTPYPDDATALAAVQSMGREKGRDGVDHAKLHPFVAQGEGRNLSATVSAQNAVIKMLLAQIEGLERRLEEAP